MFFARLAFVLVLLATIAFSPVAVNAQDSISPQALGQLEALLTEKASRTPLQQRVDSQLLAAYRME